LERSICWFCVRISAICSTGLWDYWWYSIDYDFYLVCWCSAFIFSYVGFSRLGLAIGGFIGYTGAGWLYDIAMQIGFPHLPWIVLTTIGLLTLSYLQYQFKNEPPMPHIKMRKIG
jgi:hypothetical protein